LLIGVGGSDCGSLVEEGMLLVVVTENSIISSCASPFHLLSCVSHYLSLCICCWHSQPQHIIILFCAFVAANFVGVAPVSIGLLLVLFVHSVVVIIPCYVDVAMTMIVHDDYIDVNHDSEVDAKCCRCTIIPSYYYYY
jgi:hypothetical protein